MTVSLGLCGHVTVSLICWALWSCDCQFDMLGFDVTVGLCGHVTVSLICWALWSCDCLDMLGFVVM